MIKGIITDKILLNPDFIMWTSLFENHGIHRTPILEF